MYYTKYRPQKFSEISRPNEAADALSNQVISQKTAHAYLFVGPRGTGKTSTARILAKAINCTDLQKNGDPCDECPACEAVKKGSYMDLIEIDAASNRGIDEIRELKNRVKLAPTAGKNKVYIIDEVHMLTSEAFNALLKTLEEPPVHTVFVLCTTELHKVPETVKSRCQVFKFKRATVRQITTKLERIVEEEGLTVEKSELEKIARASMGGFRDAENMLQQVADGEVTVESLLNTGSKEKYLEFCQTLWDKEPALALKIVDKIFNEGVDVYVWSGELVKHLRELLMFKSGISAESLEFTDELVSELKEQAGLFTVDWLVGALEIFVEAQSKIKTSFMPQLPLEIAVVKICAGTSSEKLSGSSQPLRPKAGLNPKVDTSIGVKTDQEDEDTVVVEEDIEIISQSGEASVEFSEVENKWGEVVEKINNINKSILGLLRAGKPVAVEGNFLTLSVSYLFHKERLESPKNRDVVERVLKEIFSVELRVRCIIDASQIQPQKKFSPREVGVLTDLNVVPIDKAAVIEMLDGGLPL